MNEFEITMALNEKKISLVFLTEIYQMLTSVSIYQEKKLNTQVDRCKYSDQELGFTEQYNSIAAVIKAS